jgi:hypothetical protein
MKQRKYWLYATWALLVVGVAAVVYFSLDTLNYEGQPTTYVIPIEMQEIKGDVTLGQTFVAPYDDLYRLDVTFCTYGRENTADVTLHIREAQEGAEDLVQTTFNASEVRDRAWHTFTFEPIPGSAGKSYFFYFHSPESTAGNALTLCGSEGDFYPHGNTWLGPASINADVAFRTHYKMPLSQKLATFGERLAKNKPGVLGQVWFYVVMAIAYVVLSALLFWQGGRFVFEEEEGGGKEEGQE